MIQLLNDRLDGVPEYLGEALADPIAGRERSWTARLRHALRRAGSGTFTAIQPLKVPDPAFRPPVRPCSRPRRLDWTPVRLGLVQVGSDSDDFAPRLPSRRADTELRPLLGA